MTRKYFRLSLTHPSSVSKPFHLSTALPQCPMALSIIEMIIIASHELPQFSFSVSTNMIVPKAQLFNIYQTFQFNSFLNQITIINLYFPILDFFYLVQKYLFNISLNSGYLYTYNFIIKLQRKTLLIIFSLPVYLPFIATLVSTDSTTL